MLCARNKFLGAFKLILQRIQGREKLSPVNGKIHRENPPCVISSSRGSFRGEQPAVFRAQLAFVASSQPSLVQLAVFQFALTVIRDALSCPHLTVD